MPIPPLARRGARSGPTGSSSRFCTNDPMTRARVERLQNPRPIWCWPALWPPPIPPSATRFSPPTAAGSAERPAQAVRERCVLVSRPAAELTTAASLRKACDPTSSLKTTLHPAARSERTIRKGRCDQCTPGSRIFRVLGMCQEAWSVTRDEAIRLKHRQLTSWMDFAFAEKRLWPRNRKGFRGHMERNTGFEPATFALARRTDHVDIRP